MSNIWFCSDLHIGHTGIERFRKHVVDSFDNKSKIYTDWRNLINKRDSVYVLGDAIFKMDEIDEFQTLPGIKYLVRGNHDKLDTANYLKCFKQVYGLLKYKEFWLSHAPIHPEELRGRVNLHGHVHYNTISKYGLDDVRYLNCCVENIVSLKGRCLISLEEIRTLMKERGIDE